MRTAPRRRSPITIRRKARRAANRPPPAHCWKNCPLWMAKSSPPIRLHCQRKHARTIVEKGGDYLLQIKGNQPNLLKQAQRPRRPEEHPLFTQTSNRAADASKCATSTPLPSNPLTADFPFARTLIVLRSERTVKKTGSHHHRITLLPLQRSARPISARAMAGADSRTLGRRRNPQSLAARCADGRGQMPHPQPRSTCKSCPAAQRVAAPHCRQLSRDLPS